MFTIYKYTSPSKRNYIGVTENSKARIKSHKQKENNLKDKTKFADVIRQYGFENLDYEILETVDTLAQANEREIYWIKFYDSIASGYNKMPGGMNAPVFTHEERIIKDIKFELMNTNKKLREIAKSFSVSIGWVSEIMNGKKRSREKIERVSQFQKGSKVHNAKLTEFLAVEIREKLEAGIKRSQIQKDYSISKTLVQLIATNQIWTHVEANYKYKKKDTNGNSVLNVESVSQLKQDIKTGTMSRAELAAKYGISIPTVDQIKAGKTWKNVL